MRTAPALLALLLVPAAALAGPKDERRFERLIRKHVITEAQVFTRFEPRLACFCKDALPALPGFLYLSEETGQLFCGVAPTFSGGSLQSYGPCQDFGVLRR